MTAPALDDVRAALRRACPGIDVSSVRMLDAGHTSSQWVAETDEGPLLVKVPRRQPEAEHLRRLLVSTRRAAEGGVPVVRFRALLGWHDELAGPVLVQEFQAGEPASAVWERSGDDHRLALSGELGRIVGQLHRIEGNWFGDPLGAERAPSWGLAVEAELDGLLGQVADDLTDLVPAVRSASVAAVKALDDSASVPALTHGDLWLPNVLVRDGKVSCLLDFEHARYADRFRDFGKLDEHIFDGFPAGREAFLQSYQATCPLPADYRARIELGSLVHALTMHCYFRRWAPQWAPQYADQVRAWLDRNS